MRTTAKIFLSAPIASLFLLVGCGAQNETDTGNGAPPVQTTTPCHPGLAGCECSELGARAACGSVVRKDGDYVTCSEGTSTCTGGHWSACAADGTAFKTIGSGLRLQSGGGLKSQGFGTSTVCTSNPCDPYCNDYEDTPIDLDSGVDSGFQTTDAALMLASTGFACTSLTVSPSIATITVNPITATPTAAFTATLAPAGCSSVGTFQWTIDANSLERDTINASGATGTFQVVAPIAGISKVTAHFANLVGNATAIINVNTVDTSAAPAGFAGVFPTTTGAAEAADFRILYPYSGTVLPLGLLPMIPQWESATAASATKVSLRYNGTGLDHLGATQNYQFLWSAIIPDTNTMNTVPSTAVGLAAGQRFPSIPTNAWSPFERTARGKDAQIVVQRYTGTVATGSLRAEQPTTIHFANGQLKGTVYYQSYGTVLARNFIGGAMDTTAGTVVFPGGAFGAATLAIRPGAAQPTVIAGSGGSDGAGTYCRVCHSAASSGSVLVSQKYGGGNLQSAQYTSLGTVPVAANVGPANGSYAWAGIYPDGNFLFGNINATTSFTSGPAPGGLDGSNTALTSSLWGLLSTPGVAVAASYQPTSGASILLSNASYTLKAALPNFSPNGTKIAFQHHQGRVCTAAGCTSAGELRSGDKRSIGIMDFNNATKVFSNFRILVDQPNTPCNTTFNPITPCTNVWPTFTPNGNGLVFEKEVHHNGDIGASSAALSDFGGTRSACDLNLASCNADGTKGELWYADTSGASAPLRMNQANGRDKTTGVANTPMVSPDPAILCRAGGFSCAVNGDCCSNDCSGTVKRCKAIKKFTGQACGAASECASNVCSGGACGCTYNLAACGGTCFPGECSSGICLNTGLCSGGTAFAPVAQTYIPAHNATVEPELNYEPTMSPTPTYDAAGTTPEYNWVVFTSRRRFGNISTLNPWFSDPRRENIADKVTPKKLWVAAISANPAPNTDPSFPAFYLPGQEWVSGNSRGYWVADACKVTNAVRSVANECTSNLDCCSFGAGTAVCSLQTPVAATPKSHCVPTPACAAVGGTCASNSDCCGGLTCSGAQCITNTVTYTTGTFTREFVSACPKQTRPLWRFFEWQAVIPNFTSIAFTAKSADTQAGLAAAAPVVAVGTANATTAGWTSGPKTVDDALVAAGGLSHLAVSISMQFNPSPDTLSTPQLTTWRMNYSCIPSE